MDRDHEEGSHPRETGKMAAPSSCTVLTVRDAEGGETRRGVARNAESLEFLLAL